MDLGAECVKGGEFAFGADEGRVEGEGEVGVVEVEFGAEEVGLEERLGLAFDAGGDTEVDEGGPRDFVEDGLGAVDAACEGSHALAGAADVREVGGGNAEGGAGEAAAMDDAAGEGPGAAEHGGGLIERSGGKGAADAGGGDTFAAPVGVGDDVDIEAAGAEEVGVALGTGAEAPILATEDGSAAECGGEVLGGQGRKGGVEGLDDDVGVGDGEAELAEDGLAIHEETGGVRGVKEGEGRAGEGEDPGGAACGGGKVGHGTQEGAVAEVDTIEGANCDDGAGGKRVKGLDGGGFHQKLPER